MRPTRARPAGGRGAARPGRGRRHRRADDRRLQQDRCDHRRRAAPAARCRPGLRAHLGDNRRRRRRAAADGGLALALDTRRITITFDSGKEFDRQQIARMYRVARVISHVATNGKVVIEADVPRRFIERLTTPVSRSRSRMRTNRVAATVMMLLLTAAVRLARARSRRRRPRPRLIPSSSIRWFRRRCRRRSPPSTSTSAGGICRSTTSVAPIASSPRR